jgi:hypothetical protein
MDDNAANHNAALGSDRSSGWDAQILITPIDDLQIYLSWSHVVKRVLNASGWVNYPYAKDDPWAIWNAPMDLAGIGAGGFATPGDPTSYVPYGTGLPMDDTPKNQGSFWINYTLPRQGWMKGISVGFGGLYEGPRQIYPAYNQAAHNEDGSMLEFSTPSRVTFNAMVQYEFKLQTRPTSVQLNVDNVLNNRKLYGLMYSAPIRWQLTLNCKL